MAADSSDKDRNAGSSGQASDRVVGRASVPPPRVTATAPANPPATPDPYAPVEYRSRSYRGRPFQDRPPHGPAPRRTGPRRGRRLLVLTVVLVGLLASAAVVAGYLWARRVDENIRREDPFAALQGRPPKVANNAQNILLLGSDSRDPESNAEEGGPRRTDTIVILHIPARQDRVYVVSIPRDLWVPVPRSVDGRGGSTMSKINAAFAWGGMPLAVKTVEDYTGVHIDHVVVVDFGGFVRVTDAVGGVDMTVEQTITSIHPPYRTFTAGHRHFTGEEALDYVRQRYQFPDGDFARMRHQQMFLRALLDKAAGLGTVTNLGALRDFVDSLADTMTVDREFSLVDLGWQLRNLRGEDLVFLVSPHRGTGTVGQQSIVRPDDARARELYEAMARDRLDDWVRVHGAGE